MLGRTATSHAMLEEILADAESGQKRLAIFVPERWFAHLSFPSITSETSVYEDSFALCSGQNLLITLRLYANFVYRRHGKHFDGMRCVASQAWARDSDFEPGTKPSPS
jgi:hypothetical protein